MTRSPMLAMASEKAVVSERTHIPDEPGPNVLVVLDALTRGTTIDIQTWSLEVFDTTGKPKRIVPLLVDSIGQRSDELDAIVHARLVDLRPLDRFERRQIPRSGRAGDRAVKLPMTRRREDEVARLFRLDSETVNGSTREMRERTRRRAQSRPITDKERQLALHHVERLHVVRMAV